MRKGSFVNEKYFVFWHPYVEVFLEVLHIYNLSLNEHFAYAEWLLTTQYTSCVLNVLLQKYDTI